MGNFIQTIFDVLTSTPGVLIYNLVLAFTFAAALQGSLMHWKGAHKAQANRQASGLFVLLLFQLAFLAASGLYWQGVGNLEQALPPLDRALTVFSLVWIIWLWAFPEPVRWIDALTFMLSVVVIIAGLFSVSFWNVPNNALPFNASWLDQAWCIFGLVLCLIGIAFLLIKHPDRWGNGLYILAVMSIGILAHLLLPPANGSFAPAIRLAQIITFPLLITLPQRLEQADSTLPTPDKQPSEAVKQRYSSDPKTVRTLIDLAQEDDPGKLHQAVIRAVSQIMQTDLGLLVSAPNVDGQLDIEGGYDAIREEVLPSHMLPRNVLPLISNALLKGRSVRLPANHTASPDMKTLSETLGLASPGNLLAVPLTLPNQDPIGGILLLSPYSSRAWSTEDQTYLGSLAESLTNILKHTEQANIFRKENEQNRQELQAAHQQIDTLHQQVPFPNSDVDALVAMQKETQIELEQLRAENEQLRIASLTITPPIISAETAQLEKDLRLTLSQVARLQNSLADANIRIMALEKKVSNGQPSSSEPDENLQSLAQELRQGVVSLNNQINLLSANEQVVQPRQVEKLKATIERLRALIGELVKTTTVSNLPVTQKIEEIDPGVIIEPAIASISLALREKNISLETDLPEHYPLIQVDRNNLKQILDYLLQNALMVTPPGGVIEFKARTQEETPDHRFFHFLVKDGGGGIPNADLESLFSGIGPDEDHTIQGLGSVHEFSLTKMLVEAQGGRMWVDSDSGHSSSFSVVLPISLTQSEEH